MLYFTERLIHMFNQFKSWQDSPNEEHCKYLCNDMFNIFERPCTGSVYGLFTPVELKVYPLLSVHCQACNFLKIITYCIIM